MKTGMKRIQRTAFLLAMLLVLGALSAFAAAETPAPGRTVRMGYYSEAGMMNGMEDGAVKSGYAYEYIQELASRAGWKYEYVYGSFSELYQMLRQGMIDMLPYITWTEARTHEFLFPDHAMGDEQFYIASLTNEKLSEDLHELEGKRVGTTRDAFQNIPFRALMEEKGVSCSLVEFDSADGKWVALSAGTVDYSIETTTIFQTIDLHAAYPFGERYPYYLIVAPQRPELLDELNRAQEALRQANPSLLDDLRLKYFKSIPLFKEIPEDGLEWLEGRDVIRVGTFNNDAPYAIENADGTITGIAPDQLAMILGELDIKLPIEWKLYPGRDEMLTALAKDEIDCIDPYYHSYSDAERDGLIISQTVYSTDFSVLYKGKYDEDTLSKIATPITRLGASYVRDNYPGAVIVPCRDGYDCLDRLEKGEATCVIMYTDALQTIASQSNKNYKFKALEAQCDVCFATLPKNAGLISIFNKAVPFLTNVERSAIQNRYNIETNSDTLTQFFRTNPEFFWGFIAFVCALTAVLVVLRARREKILAAEKKKADFFKDLTDRFTARYESVFFGDLKTGVWQVISNKNGSDGFAVGSKTSVHAIEASVLKTVHPRDREKVDQCMVRFEDIAEKIAVGGSDTMEFRKKTDEGYTWYRASLNRVTETDVLLGFRNSDQEIIADIVGRILTDEYDALYLADLELGELTPARASRVSEVGFFLTRMPYTDTILRFAETVAPQYKEDWIRFSDAVFMRQYMASDDHREFVYELPGTKRSMRRFSIDVLERVNGEAVTVLFSFMGIDDYRAQAILLQQRMAETNRIIEALSEDFSCVNYVDLSGSRDEDITEGFRTSALLIRLIPGWEEAKSFRAKLDLLIDNVVYGPDAERFCAETRRDVLLDKLQGSDVVYVNTRLVINGDIRFYQFKFSAVRKDGQLIGAVAGLHSVDEQMKKEIETQHRLESALDTAEKEKRRNDLLIETFSAGKWSYDINARDEVTGAHYSSGVYKNTDQDESVAVSPMGWVDRLHPDDRERVLEEFTAAIRDHSGNTKYDTTFRVLGKSGHCIWCKSAGRVIRSADGTGEFFGMNVDITDQIESQTKQKAQLEEALTMAQAANRAKTVFLNNMSHDIRTPMNAIIGYTGLAVSHIDSRDMVQDYLGKIGQSSAHLLSLINDVLDMSRIESGRMILDEKPENLPDIIHALHDIVQPDIHMKQQDFFISVEGLTDENIVCDRLRLNQVLLNILSNSVKYTAPGGTISLRITEKEVKPSGYATYEFRIRDNGIGMDREYLKVIFEPFTRMRSSTVSGIQGTGLGMAITKNLIDMMGGTIGIQSEPGQGTDVTVCFDFKLAAPNKETAVLTEVRDLRCLVIDDDPDTALSVQAMLNDAGMRAEWCTSGKEGVNRTREACREGDPFRLFIVDWLMPGMNGIETTRTIRETAGSEVPVIVLSSYDWSDIRDQAKEAGITAFLSKPLFPSDLSRILSTCFSREAQEAEPAEYDFTGKKILLVEDNVMNREIATELLEEDGFLLDTAEDGSIAVDKMKAAKTGDYDLVLMDVQMPVMDGYTATRLIRALGTEISKIPIIAMTANAFEEDRKLALDAGMNEHITKPIDIPKLKQTLARFL